MRKIKNVELFSTLTLCKVMISEMLCTLHCMDTSQRRWGSGRRELKERCLSGGVSTSLYFEEEAQGMTKFRTAVLANSVFPIATRELWLAGICVHVCNSRVQRLPTKDFVLKLLFILFLYLLN
jgi:hypothetical protein